MSDLSIGAIGAVPSTMGVAGASALPNGVNFGDALRGALDRVNQLQQAADQASQEFAVGQSGDVAGTLIAVEKGNLAFQLTLQIRNKLLDAYQEIMRMPM
jgi:flagellar hook-basal body complex protein FliE